MFRGFTPFGDQFVDKGYAGLDVAAQDFARFFYALTAGGQKIAIILLLKDDFSAGFHAEFPAHVSGDDDSPIFGQFQTYLRFWHISLLWQFHLLCHFLTMGTFRVRPPLPE